MNMGLNLVYPTHEWFCYFDEHYSPCCFKHWASLRRNLNSFVDVQLNPVDPIVKKHNVAWFCEGGKISNSIRINRQFSLHCG